MSLLEINNCLSQLELQRQGSLFAKLDRITKWLLGTYAPQDFVEPEGPGDVIARRKTLRDEFLRQTLSEDDGSFVKATNWSVHPLDVILRSEQILHILQRTTASAAPNSQNTQHQDTTAADENARNDDDSTQTTPQRVDADATNTHEDSGSTSGQQEDSDEQQPQPGRMIRLLAEDGSEFCVPRQVGALLAELIVKVRSLEELVLDQQRHAASSTHIADSRPGQNVHFANTYTIHGHDEWLGLQPTPPPAQRNGQAGLLGVNDK